MKTFEFSGTLQSSKSLLNRAQVIQAYHPDLQIDGHSQSRDVQFLKAALSAKGHHFDAGEGGTTFRFLAFYLSRLPGQWKIKGSSRLMSRPSQTMVDLLTQLSVDQIAFKDNSMTFVSRGWKVPDRLHVDLSQSSQFASGLLLNAWGLNQDLILELSKTRVSDGYLDMTLQMLKQAGMQIEVFSEGLRVPKKQMVLASSLVVEQDLSSAFVVAALAAARGSCTIPQFPMNSLQPDRQFLDFFRSMNIPYTLSDGVLQVQRAEKIQPLRASLRSAPDLFPVLCILLSKAQGESHLFDTPQLIHKESNRLLKTSELLTKMKIQHQLEEGGIKIQGAPHHHEFFEFDPDEDHRLAFAAAVAKSMGYRLRVLHPDVVDKSFPDFWSLISGGPG